MSESKVELYYKNVMADVVGDEHGITVEQFGQLELEVTQAIHDVNNARIENKTPYRDLPYNAKYAESVKEAVSQFKDNCEILVVLGIGGSALGNIAMQTALNPYMYNLDDAQRKGCPKLFVLDNVDPSQLGSFIDYLGDKLDKTVINVVSKSGRTAETASQFLTIKQLFEEKLGADCLKKHFIATTDANEGTLRKIADDAGLTTLEVPDGVGGRFSVLSPVGLFSAAMCGVDIDELLAGARAMDLRVATADMKKNPALLNAAINWHYYNRDKKISVMMPYSYALKDMSDWYRQLWAESLGKTNDLEGNEVFVGPTPVKALGATDQHSQV
jgi:glucose-6-phosphate isomerase